MSTTTNPEPRAVPTVGRADGAMGLGLQLGQVGRQATAEAVRATAALAEAEGYDSVWVLDRLLAPVAPRSPYPGCADGALPSESAAVLDPLGVLAAVAATTSRIRLGTSVLVAPWYPPVLLARLLTTIDVLSHGRLTVGLGVGWSLDEYDAVGLPRRDLGDRLEELLDVFTAVWGSDPVAYEGRRLRIAPSAIDAKPDQRGGPPILLAGYTPAGLDRVARRADGWTPAGLPIEALAPMWSQVRGAAAGYGRDPERLRLVVRANITLTPSPLASDRPAFAGDLAQVRADLAATERAGADEVIVWLTGNPPLDQALDFYAAIRR